MGPDPDFVIFVSGLQDANKNIFKVFLLITGTF
jgi:hypothetical protein